MNYDLHILMACFVGVVFAGLLLTAAGRNQVSEETRVAGRIERASRRRAA